MDNIPRIGVFRGGPSNEYEVSLKTGEAILKVLRNELRDKYEPVDILVDKDGTWFINGVPHTPSAARNYFDLALNAMHGSYGEDGKIQQIFENHRIPFTGSGSLSSAIGMNKILSKKVLADHDLKSPYWKQANSSDVQNDPERAARELFSSFIFPAVVKPASSGSSVGVSLVSSKSDLARALTEAASHGDQIIIEEYIPGIESTCGVIEGFRGEKLYALPPVEIRSKNGLFDYAAKYGGQSEEIVPASFSFELKRKIEELAREVHKAFRLRHYSRTDFIIHPRRGIYVLETNTLPGLTDEALIPKSLRSVGSNLAEFVDHIIVIALGV